MEPKEPRSNHLKKGNEAEHVTLTIQDFRKCAESCVHTYQYVDF